MTSSNGIIFRVAGRLCGEFIGPGEFPTQRPVTQNYDVFFVLRLNKQLSKQWWAGDLRRYRSHYDVTVMGAMTMNKKMSDKVTQDIGIFSGLRWLISNEMAYTIYIYVSTLLISNISKKVNIHSNWHSKMYLYIKHNKSANGAGLYPPTESVLSTCCRCDQ